jgi:FAD/FMN-containing dehydrogenase
MVCYTGDLAEGERVVEPLRHLANPLVDVIGPMPYPAIFALSEIGETRGRRQRVRSLFLKTLDDRALHTFVEAARAIMSPETMVQLRILGGAMSRIAPDAAAFAHRDKQALMLGANFGPDAAARVEHFWRALQGYSDGVYVNFLAEDGEQRINEAYPPATYARLVALKNRYDPTNLLHLNQNIKPTL